MSTAQSRIRTLKNPPIIEAIIEIRVVPAGGIPTAKQLSEFARRFREEFPTCVQRNQRQINVETKGDAGEGDGQQITKVVDEFYGYLLTSGDGASRVQFGRRAFSIHRLKPYQSWDCLIPSFQKYWAAYQEAVGGVERIERIGVRFMNEFSISNPDQVPIHVADFLVALPGRADGWPKVIESYLAQFVIHEGDNSATVHQSLVYSGDGSLVVGLDIDAFAIKNINRDEGEILGRLNALRDLKNGIFFGAFTDRTIQIFE